MDNSLQHHTGEQSAIHGRKRGSKREGGLVIKKSESRTESRSDYFPLINYLDVLVLTIIAQEKTKSLNVIVLNKYANYT